MAYQSLLLSALVKVRLEDPINSYQDILDRDLPLYIVSNTIVEHLFKTSPFAIVRETFEKQSILFRTNSEGGSPAHILDAITDGKAVGNTALSRYFGSRHKHRITEKLTVGTFPCGYYYDMNNPLLYKANGIIQILMTVVSLKS